jgi:hypothetical protein
VLIFKSYIALDGLMAPLRRFLIIQSSTWPVYDDGAPRAWDI